MLSQQNIDRGLNWKKMKLMFYVADVAMHMALFSFNIHFKVYPLCDTTLEINLNIQQYFRFRLSKGHPLQWRTWNGHMIKINWVYVYGICKKHELDFFQNKRYVLLTQRWDFFGQWQNYKWHTIIYHRARNLQRNQIKKITLQFIVHLPRHDAGSETWWLLPAGNDKFE